MPIKGSVSRRTFLKGLGAAGAMMGIGLPPLEAMFNGNGTAYVSETVAGRIAERPLESRFVLWFNGNGIPERYWVPVETGPDYTLTPCLSPLEPFREDIHVITGLDNAAARLPGPGNGHHNSMSALVSGTPFSGRGAGGPSIDQVIASKIGGSSRFRSLQVGVCQESFGESMQRNMSWASRDRALPPEMIPHRLFDRLFGAREEGWTKRKRSVLDAARGDVMQIKSALGRGDQLRLDDYLASIRDMERAISDLPPEYSHVQEPEVEADLKDWPRIAKIQSDLLAHALATSQTRVASYMLTKCQGLSRFPWLGLTAERHHDYTHDRANTPEGQRILRDICKWHVEEFAYLLAKLKSIPEGDGTLLDHCCLIFAHEHAEADFHKNNGLALIVAGHAGGLVTGTHTKVTGTVGDLYLTVANKLLAAGVDGFPTAEKALPGIV
jgi:Protein of unknown function (DUF1552)/TAT (twin-arginine translocation) pathway signal sequence